MEHELEKSKTSWNYVISHWFYQFARTFYRTLAFCGQHYENKYHVRRVAFSDYFRRMSQLQNFIRVMVMENQEMVMDKP